MGRQTPKSVLQAIARQNPGIVKEMPGVFAGIQVEAPGTESAKQPFPDLNANKPQAQRRSKFGAERCELDGDRFDSKGERDAYLELCKRFGKRHVLRQVWFPLPGALDIVIDFVVMTLKQDLNGIVLLIEYKGHETREYRLKKRQFEALYGRRLTVLKKPGDVSRFAGLAPAESFQRLRDSGEGPDGIPH